MSMQVLLWNSRKTRRGQTVSGAIKSLTGSLLRAAPFSLLMIGLLGQALPPLDRNHPDTTLPPEDVRLPNGKLQKDAILADDYEKTLKDAQELARLSDELKKGLENDGKNVLSLQMLKKTEEIEKLAKRIHDRLRRY